MKKLYNAALKAYNNSYSPYSKFKVGACVLLKDGNIISGCNIENASYGLSNCAERTTLFKTYSEGYRKDDIVQMLIIADTEKPVSPCGACRQVMAELMNLDADVILTNLKEDYIVFKVKELLPYNFDDKDLKNE